MGPLQGDSTVALWDARIVLVRDVGIFGPQGEEFAALIETAMYLPAEDALAANECWLRFHYAIEPGGDYEEGPLMTARLEVEDLAPHGSTERHCEDLARAFAWSVMSFLHPALSGQKYCLECDDEDVHYNFLQETATGLALRHKLTTASYETLTLPWRRMVGPIHPNDDDVNLERPEVEFRARRLQERGMGREEAVVMAALGCGGV